MIKQLKLSEIVTDAGTQVRVGLNETTVADYAEAMAARANFPPVIVFHDDTRYIVADGFHRIQAASSVGATEIECDIREGNKGDALKFALGCNAHHGLRRTNADKRHAVELAVQEFGKFSDVALAEMCAVNRELVSDVRKINLLESSRSGTRSVPQPRVGLDGRERRLPPPPRVRGDANRDQTAVKAEIVQVAQTMAACGDVCLTLSPPPSEVLDGTGWRVPTQLIPFWQRSGEVQAMLTMLSQVKSALRTAQQNKDKLFGEVNFSSALSQLDQAWTDIKTAKPFAVCPTCQGQLPAQCTFCNGRGFISEHRWKTCATREDKEFRFKAQQPDLLLGSK
ncbi:MAG: hypothetical protein QOF48_923 [Verrucomicrobiota bacterium]|jgi:ParB-like chromosome segregation protein Spo0J